MSQSNSEKIPTKLYLIVNNCENLPDLRSENEKKKGKEPMWRVTFPDAKESLGTEFVKGLARVCWMCECFLTLKVSSKTFSLVVLDENSRKAGKGTINFSDIPIGDKDLLKPGRLNEGARDAYCNLQPSQKMTINSSDSTINFWIWALEFKKCKNPESSLKRLKSSSTSFANNLKDYILPNTRITNTNPFLSDFNDGMAYQNPAEGDGDFKNKFGNPNFESEEHQKFRPYDSIPKKEYIENFSDFSKIRRISSLPELNKISQVIMEKFRQTTLENRSSLSVTEIDMTDFTKLSELYNCRKTGNIEEPGGQFFAALNNAQREYAGNIIKIHSLEVQNKDLIGELNEIRNYVHTLKEVLITNNLTHVLQNIGMMYMHSENW